MKKTILAMFISLSALSFSAPTMAVQVTGPIDFVSTQGEGSQTVWVLSKIGGSFVYYVGTNGGVASVLSDAMHNNKPATVYGGGFSDFKTVSVAK